MMTAHSDLDAVLGAVTRLPLRYWREKLFFFGTPDRDLRDHTGGRFPKTLIPKHTHPVFSIKKLPADLGFPAGLGFKVCPCSSKRPFGKHPVRLVREGYRLLHTGYVNDRNTYLVEVFQFNIPPSVASWLRFKGEVPEECILSIGPDEGHPWCRKGFAGE